MKHEIYFNLNQDKKTDTTLARVKSTLPKQHMLIKMADTDTVLNLIKKRNIKIEQSIVNSVINDYRILLNSDMPQFLVDKIIDKLKSINDISKVSYHGILQGSSGGFDFASLKGKPEKNPDFFKQQQHFLSPFGVDSMYGWCAEGGSGEGMNIFVSDVGIYEHPDIEYIAIDEMPHHDHATFIVAILSAKNNDINDIGIVPDAKVYVSRYGNFQGVYQYGKPGDVVSLSIINHFWGVDIPWPSNPENNAHIILSTALGVTCCYCSANQGNNLDEVPVHGKFIFNKNHPDYLETTGLCVGGGTVAFSGYPTRSFNTGSIVGAFAESEQVLSLDGTISGTSFSTPIIAGVVAQIQSIHKKHFGHPLTPAKVIELVTNPAHGVQGETDNEHDHAIMPDMRKILAALKINPTNTYPENYGVSNEEIAPIQTLVYSLFEDESHSSLVPDVTLEDIFTVEYELTPLKPCAKKIELITLKNRALELYNDNQQGEILKDNVFTTPSNSWTISGYTTEFTDHGVIISNIPYSGSLGVLYNRPTYFNSEKEDYILSAEFEVLEWSTEVDVVAVIGGYLPDKDMITDSTLAEEIIISHNTKHVEMIISGHRVSRASMFPGFGVRGAKKLLVKKISLQKKQ